MLINNFSLPYIYSHKTPYRTGMQLAVLEQVLLAFEQFGADVTAEVAPT